MRFTFSVLLLLLCASCAAKSSRGEPVEAEAAPTGSAVNLPRLAVAGVDRGDGVDESEAAALASEYFARYVSGCGMPDRPVEDGGFWRARLYGGYGGSDHGTLRIARDGSVVVLVPPKGGFKPVTLRMLSRRGLR